VNSSSLPPKTDREEEYADRGSLSPSLLKVGLLAAASALAGGLAAAWYYRKTLARLRQAEALGLENDPTSANGDADDLGDDL
jgi:hypothetical protein